MERDIFWYCLKEIRILAISYLRRVPIVTYGLLRYLYLLHRDEMGQDTSAEIFSDWHLLVTLLMWLAAILLILT